MFKLVTLIISSVLFSSGVSMAASYPTELHNGPMLGCMTDTSVRCWVRTTSAVEVQFRVSTSSSMTDPIYSNILTTSEDNSGTYYTSTYYVATMEVTGLEAETKYYYEVLVNGSVKPIVPLPSFTTFPANDAQAVVKIGFGGGAPNPSEINGNEANQIIWESINGYDLDAFLLLGDNVYLDRHPDWTNEYDYDNQIRAYLERHSNTYWRNLISSKPIYAVWDDHDFAYDNVDGSAANDSPAWKPITWSIFKDNWNNPSYGGNGVNGVKGCWFSFSIGKIDFFMLDSRYYRLADRTTMLGPVQKQWLKDQLSQSTAVFKVIVSPVPWHDAAKPSSDDPWRGFPAERTEIFSHIRDNEIDGVITLSADRHRTDAVVNHIPDCYDLYEFESSRLTNTSVHDLIVHPDWLFGYNAGQIFGMVTFDLTKTDPTVTYNVVKKDGDMLPAPYEVTLKRSQLSLSEPLKGDIDNSGFVDVNDISLMAIQWLDSTDPGDPGAVAGIITYVDAVHGVNGNTVGVVSGDHSDWQTTASSDTDGLWQYREKDWASDGTIYMAMDNEPDVVAIKTTVTGLVAGDEHPLYVYFGANGEQWDIHAGLTAETLVNYKWQDAEKMDDIVGTTSLYRAYLGTSTVDSSGNLSIYVDDNGTNLRSFYDGMGYELPYCGQSGQVYKEADINQDCYVNLADLAMLSLDWLLPVY